MKTIDKCEVCEQEKEVSVHYGNMKFCDECWKKEEAASAEHQSIQNQQKRVDEYNNQQAERIKQNELLREAREIDNRIEVRSDLFNAATKSIVEIKEAIDKDDEIKNKPYELAKVLTERFVHLRNVIFELQKETVEKGNEQKAIQVYLNGLANQLRSEEREKLKIADINYKPATVKQPSVKKISTRTTSSSKTKIDKKELRDWAAKLGVSEFTLQTVVVSKGISVAEAGALLLKTIEASKVQS